MGDTARLYQYKALLEARRLVTRQELMALGEVSLATFKRDIAKLRDQLGMPVQFDRDRGAYFLDRSDVRTELPGLWFSPEELVALLTIQRLIEQLQPGLVGLKLKPLQKKLTDLLKAKGFGEPEIASRVRMTFAGKRQLEPKAFQAVALATIARKKITITHFNRQSGASTRRTVSPQQLVHYRDNWYVDTWCHTRESIRSFSVDVIDGVDMLDEAAREVDPTELQRITQTSYGIFAGQPTAWAVLRFSPQRARWIEGEIWHPEQLASFEQDGSYLLKLPYSDDRELLGDILRHGADVQVLEPAALRTKVQKTLLEAASRYL
jgi:predicted DNA-binding transcriptional regulator YafY